MRFRISVVFGVLAMFAAGCNRGDGVQRVVVSGNVTYEGEPVAQGSILFVPSGDGVGPSMDAQLVDGRYRIDRQGGLPVGKYRVQILGFRNDAVARNTDGFAREHANAPQQYLPEKYNMMSMLEVAIEPDASKTTKDFLLAR
jgi:hypothetical protein